MSLSSTCIKRPVLATVLNLLLVIVGSIGLLYLGVRDYPSVDPPVISVSTSFVGANADVIETQITEPLESAINGIQGIRSLWEVSFTRVINSLPRGGTIRFTTCSSTTLKNTCRLVMPSTWPASYWPFGMLSMPPR